ncbi:MAG: hypothetical protein IKS41_04130 [Alphaproteobacteria bacterium]|nr:hypothetical protein [Alphaproteobacteria bacterium]
MKKKFNLAGLGKKEVILLVLLGIITCCLWAFMIRGRLDMFFVMIITFVFLGTPILSIVYWIRHKKWGCLIACLLLVALFSALVYYTNSLQDGKIVHFLRRVRATLFIILPCLIVGQGFLMLFWKRAQKLGLWLLFITLTTLCAITNQILDYVIMRNGQHPVATGIHYSDYGFVSSGYDQEEAYYNNQEK